MRPFICTTFALVSAIGCSSAPDEWSPESVDDSARPIIGGSPATAYPEAVLVNMKIGGASASACSGAVIAPRVVLTAGHCVAGYDGWDIVAPHAGGQKAKAVSAATYDWDNESEFVDPTQHDVGLVFLASDIVLSSYPKIATSPVANGTKVVNIGRIKNGKFSNSSLYVSQPVSVRNGKEVGYPLSYWAKETIESGDSGGPDILPGSVPHTIVAVNSGSGGGTEVLARVDLVASWIQDQIAQHSGSGQPNSDPCKGVTFEGQCDDNQLSWCEGGLHQVDCGAKKCGWDAKASFYNCL
jgi:secreted trypsin-like serine protease